MSGYIEGTDRGRSTLFPDRLEDWIGEDNPVRVIDLFVDETDLGEIGFRRTFPATTGRPGSHPSVLLKLFNYGYLNRVPSSRALEREAGRNKFKAVNNRDKNFTKGKIASRIAHLEASVERYIDDMVRIDRQEEGEARMERRANLHRRYGRIQQEIQRLQDMDRALKEAPDSQISLTDPDSRSMATSAKGSGFVGYNAQAAVDAETHLIVTHDVINDGRDREQLAPMAKGAKAALGRNEMRAVADKGDFSGREILACHEDGVTTTLPRPETSGNRKKGMYVKADFAYDADADIYRRPAGETLRRHDTTEEQGLVVNRRWTAGHPFGAIKAWMGATHFRMRTLGHVRTEMAFHVLAYNIKRMISLIGVRGLLAAIPA